MTANLDPIDGDLTRSADATLSVARAARVLGVHPNTVRAWTDAGRLPYIRINDRGDRRYRRGDLDVFLAAATGAATFPERAGRGRAGDAGNADSRISGQPTAAFDANAATELVLNLSAIAARSASAEVDLEEALSEAARAIGAACRCESVVAYQLEGEELVPVASSGPFASRLLRMPRTYGVLGEALVPGAAVVRTRADDIARVSGRPLEIAAPILGEPGTGTWGVLLAVPRPGASDCVTQLLPSAAAAAAGIVRAASRGREVARKLHRAEALHRVAIDIGQHKDLEQVLGGLIDHALVLFEGDRAAVYLKEPDGSLHAAASRGLSESYLSAVQWAPTSLSSLAMAAGRPIYSVNYRDDPRGGDLRAAVVQEGFDTLCVQPLLVDGEAVGNLNVYHDKPHEWSPEELDAFAELGMQAAMAISAARDYRQLESWAAQLQSIQDLGTRLNRMTSVADIGHAIATELRQLIDYHNVRVYRRYGDDLVPVAMLGQVGEYVDETPEQLKVKVGEGITGWVAANREPAYLADAGNDSRSSTIPGTDDDLDESMLLAPMVFEDEVLGVLVLSKLGLSQFRDDDLRLLVIYASFAAQAMANADSTERLRAQSAALERQLRNQRALLGITETILQTLDHREILELVAERLGELVGFDNLSIELRDPNGGITPVMAKGEDAELYMEPWAPGEQGLAPWVVDHNEPALVPDETVDPRISHFHGEAEEGTMIVVPLRGRDGSTGVITLERKGKGKEYTTEEFELAQLFAAQVSIAMQNAEVMHGVEVKAATDDLTGLYDDGAFRERLAGHVAAGEQLSLIMLDLDGFKSVNDTLGHQAGDRLLKDIAAAIKHAARESDQVFRYGGDEFTVLLPGADATDALRVAERVRSIVAAVGDEGTSWHAGGARVSASIGVATYPSDGETAEEVLLAADRACYVAKRRGGSRVATAAEGLALAGQMSLQEPTPIDPSRPAAA
jgi:diguanylate cyclase (GGDEF)-like protein/excisionase family DNA binding protein